MFSPHFSVGRERSEPWQWNELRPTALPARSQPSSPAARRPGSPRPLLSPRRDSRRPECAGMRWNVLTAHSAAGRWSPLFLRRGPRGWLYRLCEDQAVLLLGDWQVPSLGLSLPMCTKTERNLNISKTLGFSESWLQPKLTRPLKARPEARLEAKDKPVHASRRSDSL